MIKNLAPINFDFRTDEFKYNIITDYNQVKANVLDYKFAADPDSPTKKVYIESGEWALVKNKTIFTPKDPSIAESAGGNTNNLFFMFLGSEEPGTHATGAGTIVPSHIGFIYQTKKFDDSLKTAEDGTPVTIGAKKIPMKAERDQKIIGYVHSKASNGIIEIRVVPH